MSTLYSTRVTAIGGRSEDAYKRATEPKEFVWVKGAGHVDLYDRVNRIPFDKLTSFFAQHLSA
jgi:fermentation-respiration switch protein FrsA (DUF1100 family)